ncbi:hypothetical protein ACJJTC_010349 [Scirpophaga incertulas]
MAESATEIPINIEENIKEAVKNVTEKPPSSIEGVAIAYLSLVIMAILPIFLGSFRSVKYLNDQKKSGERADTMSNKDALMFPLVASCALFGLYVFFQFFSKEYINLLLTVYFFFLGVLALSHLLSPIISFLVPASIPNVPYHIMFTRGERESLAHIVNYKFTTYDVICVIISLGLGAWYLFKKHWIANNLFGMAFAINGVELLHLNNVVTGCILLSGLFLYDIFWVSEPRHGAVAKSFEAPIKLVFPQDLLVNGLSAENFAMLGLGDIVVPGIFIALLRGSTRACSAARSSTSAPRSRRTPRCCTWCPRERGHAAAAGAAARRHPRAVQVGPPTPPSHTYTALLYLVPACVGTPLLLALLRGDIHALFRWAPPHPPHLPHLHCAAVPGARVRGHAAAAGAAARRHPRAVQVGPPTPPHTSHTYTALLYLVPACVGTPLLLALLRGDIHALFRYFREEKSFDI